MGDKTQEALTFGFDIGIASVGWCVLGENRIVDLGVRCFNKAETAKEGDSLNLARRTARLMQRRLRRRAWRFVKLARLLKREGVITGLGEIRQPSPISPWRLRVDGLDRRLTNDEWARVIYHLCKHRGFHWVSRAEEKKAEGDKKEGGKVKQGLSDTQRRMTEKGYRSAAEMVWKEFVKQALDEEGRPRFDKTGQPIPEGSARNKQGDYGKALSRVLLADELALLFQRQRTLGNPHASSELEEKILGNGDRKSGLFWEQKPPLAGADLLKMLGRCTFERKGGPDGKGEYRAPKASFSAERHVWLTRLNNLRIVVDGVTRPLNPAERQILLPLPYAQAGNYTYKHLRAALTKSGLSNFNFAGLAEDKEKDILVKLPAWQTLSKTLKGKGLETEWKSMAGAAIGGDPTLLDDIARVLSVFKDGLEVDAELRKLPLPGGEKTIEALSEISFDKFHNLSLKALRKIVPHMEAGLSYDEACQAVGYHHSQLHTAGAGKHKYLPPFYAGRDNNGRMVFADDIDVPKNPVVLRALNQARKVLNALVRTYGSPVAVHIEMARDLSRPLTGYRTDSGKYIEGRRDIEAKQREYRERNERDKSAFTAEYGIVAKSRELEKFQLYREQQGKCAYSLKPLNLSRVLLDIGYAEVDHALPYSRSYDDGKNNKVLALTEENHNKGNRTPYEYLTSFDGGENGERWRNFVAFVESNKSYRLAKRQRLLRKDFTGKAAGEFRERNLNDTRYICKFFKNYVEDHLILAPKVGTGGTSETTAKRCVVLNGQTTAFLRARWGLLKIRGDSDRHHALDAAVVAACSHSMVQRLASYAKDKELAKVRDGFPDPETGEIVSPAMLQQLHAHFPDPWPHFRDELEARLGIDDPQELRARMEMLSTYPPEALAALHPLFVSRAPQRRNGGAAHKDTIYAIPDHLQQEKPGCVTQKVPLASLKPTDLDKLIDPRRNQKLYAAIRVRLEAHGGKGDQAFPPDKPLRKPDRDGNPTGPIVRSVTMRIDKLSGIPVRGGIAKNDCMLRVDVFRHKKDGKFHLVPVYVHHAVVKELPNRAIVAFKDEGEWTLIDDDYDFYCSVHPNDLLRITLKTEKHLGYFAGCDRSTGAFNLWSHDRNRQSGKDGMIRGIGIKTAVTLEKLHVDVLGNIYPAPQEQRRGLA